ncbi:hypothetical protein [Acinetobacter bereziniae]|jgi:F0F1-type ATP synthase assembly protein I|uniref:hypothetical protein n=1 Tax=Acinetobacter bereziniae TaxID=106648 RepID=UPI000EF6EC5F|nr:hypothetical protein [Acinetobacter bereziniae]
MKILLTIVVLIVAYSIVEPESFGGYLLVLLVAGLISIGITLAFMAILVVIGLFSKIFTRD